MENGSKALPTWAMPVIFGSVALVILVVIITILLVLKAKKKPARIKVDDEFTNNLITLFGGKENITEVSVDNGRLKIKVNDLDVVNLEGIKEIATNGVFVTGNIVKTLFKLDSQTIKKALDKAL